MRSIKTFARDILKKPPVIFPWVALFHIAMLLFQVWLYHDSPFPSKDWIQPAWMLVYTIAWLFVCDMRKWAALLYIALSMGNLVLYLNTVNTHISPYYSPIYLIDMLFSFFLLFYYKRFD